MRISGDIKYVGVNDRDIDLFEGQFKVPDGMAYNSYVILDEKTAVMDTVDVNFKDEWLANVEKALEKRQPAYGAGSFGQYKGLYAKVQRR